MSNQPIRVWQTLLQQLSDLKSTFDGAADSLLDCEPINQAFRSVGALPSQMPRAVLKKLVLEQQVSFGQPTNSQVCSLSKALSAKWLTLKLCELFVGSGQ